MNHRLTSGILLIVIAGRAGCSRPIRGGELIDRYNKAECIPVKYGPGISPPTRAWDYQLETLGSLVRISGAEMPGGRILVKYLSDGKTTVAADAGDYVYPADVRFDRPANDLIVKASGLAVFGGPQTWVIEYDLKARRERGRTKVDPAALAPECPVK